MTKLKYLDIIGKTLRLFPEFKGKHRIAKFLIKKSISKALNLEVRGKFDCHYILPNLRENIGFDIFVNGIYEKVTNIFLQKCIPIGSTFLDIGANLGSITIPLIKKRSDIRAICIEASPWIFSFLSRNIVNNNLNVKFINSAVWNESNLTKPFFVPKDQYGKSSFSSAFTRDSELVETITIEDLMKLQNITKINFIKIDIEGYEYFAFDGSKNILLDQNAPDILFEFVDWAEELAGVDKGAAQNFLKECGYQLYNLHESGVLTPLNTILTKGYAMLFASKGPVSIKKQGP